MLLSALVILPILAAVIGFFTPAREDEASTRLNLLLSLIIAGLGLPLILAPTAVGDLVQPWFTLWGTNAHVQLHLVSDGLSAWLIQLVTWLTPVAILGSRHLVPGRMREFAATLLVMESLMIGALLARDLVVFYFCFEAMLLPMLILIAAFGGSERRSAALWFFLYTMLGSVFMLVGVWYLAWKFGTTDFSLVANRLAHWQGGDVPFYLINGDAFAHHWQCWRVSAKELLFLAFSLAFAVKVPLVPFHSWQARTYAETPAGAAVLLAGAMAKIGCYGFIRLVLPFFPAQSAAYAHPIICLALIGVVGGALVALYQEDVKRLIAYSSLSHLGLVIIGIFSLQAAGAAGVTVMMVAHGLSVGALFLLVGYIEARTTNRGIDDFGGLADQMPIFAVLFIIAALASAALPGTGNFVGEFLILFGAFVLSWKVALVAGISVILGAVYLLRLVQRWFYGVRHESLARLADLGPGESLAVAALLAVSLFFGFYPAPITSQANPVVTAALAPAGLARSDLASGRLSLYGGEDWSLPATYGPLRIESGPHAALAPASGPPATGSVVAPAPTHP